MKKYLVASILGLAGILAARAEVPLPLTAAPAGMQETVLLAQSDTYVAPAYTRQSIYAGKIGAISGDELFVEGLPNWNLDQFSYEAGVQPNHYYVRLGAAPESDSNPLEGWAFPVIGNDTASLTLDTSGKSLAGIPNGTAFKIIPYWTLNTLFPASQEAVSFVASTSGVIRKTEIFLFNYFGPGINKSAAATFYFHNGAWRRFARPIADNYGDEIILPNTYFIVRNSGAESLHLRITGEVIMGDIVTHIVSQDSSLQDNLLSTGRPVPVRLADLGLIESGAFVQSLSPLMRKDELYVFNHSRIGYNKSPIATYYYYNGAWRRFGQSLSLSFDDVTIGPDEGFFIRKAPEPTSREWINHPYF